MKLRFIFGIAVLALLMAACGGSQPTAHSSAPPTEAPPTEVPATVEPTADLTATAEAEAAAIQAQYEAIAAVDLELAGLSTTVGSMAWVQNPEPITIFIDVAGEFLVQALDPDFTAANFVMGVDITWDTTISVANCGLIFRSQGADIELGEQAEFDAYNLYGPIAEDPELEAVLGVPFWVISISNFGQWQSDLIKISDSAISQEPNSTNHYVISANGTTIRVYANGEELGTTDIKQSMSEGMFGLASYLTDPGSVRCTYNNLYIWELP